MTQQMTRREVMKLGIAGALGTGVAANSQPSRTVAPRDSSSIVVDANMHWLPETLFSDSALLQRFIGAIPREYGIPAKVMAIPGKELRQIVIEMPKGYEVLNYAENQHSAKDQVAYTDRAKIDKPVLRLPCWQESVDLETCKLINNGLAEHTKRYLGRFYALAVAPPWGSKDSLKEVERCITRLGFRGVQMAAHYGELYLDEEEFKAVFQSLEPTRRAGRRASHTSAGGLPVDSQVHQPEASVRPLYRAGDRRGEGIVQWDVRAFPESEACALDAGWRIVRVRQHAGSGTYQFHRRC